MPKLTEYLLKLGTDAEALAEYRHYRDAQGAVPFRAYLMQDEGPGLTAPQADALISNVTHRIQDAVAAELLAESSQPDDPTAGIKLTFFCETNHIELPRPD